MEAKKPKVYLSPIQFEVYQCIKSGMDAEEIKEALNLTRSHYNAITYQLRQIGLITKPRSIHRVNQDNIDEIDVEVDKRKKRVHLSMEKKKELVERYQSEKITQIELAKIYGISRMTVCKILKEYGEV